MYATLTELAQELWRQQDTKHDYVVDTRRMNFDVEGDEPQLFFDSGDPREMEGDAQPGDTDGTDGGPLTEHAHYQLSERLGIPKRYYDRMRADAPYLLRDNVQHWLYKTPETRMIRMLDGRVRAVLSNRYRRLDNLDLMEHAILPAFGQHAGDGDLQFRVAALTDQRLYLRATTGRLSAAVKIGQVVEGGVEIRNSETGAGALVVAPFAMVLACTNGMTRADTRLRRYHVGREQEETAYAIYRDDTLAADDAAFFLKVRDAITAALEESAFNQWVDAMRDAAGSPRLQNPVEATKRLARASRLTELEETSIMRHLVEGGDLSRWGMVNAITRAAQDVDGFDRRAELEQVGTALVEVEGRQWDALAAA